MSVRRASRLPLPILAVGAAVAASLLGDSMLYAVMPSRPAAGGLWVGGVRARVGGNRFVRLLSNPLAAVVMDRFGTRLPFAAAMVGAVAVTATYGWATAFWLLLLARLAWGVCWSVLRLGAFWTVLEEANDSNRGLLMGTYSAVARVGGIVGMIAGGVLTDAIGHRATLSIFAALTAAGGLGWFAATRSQAPAAGQATAAGDVGGGLAAVLGDRRLLAVSVGGMVTALVFAGLVMASLGFYLGERYGDDVRLGGAAVGVATLTGVLLGARSLLNLPVAPLAGHLSDRLGRTGVAVSAFAIGALGLALLAAAPPLALVAAGVIVAFAASTALNAVLTAAAGDLAAPDRRAAVLSTYATFLDVGAALGPLVGLSTGSLGVLRATFLGAALALLLVAVWYRAAFADAVARSARRAET